MSEEKPITITVASWFDKKLYTDAKRVVSISVSAPQGKKFNIKLDEFVPPWEIVEDIKKGRIDEQKYKDLYILKIARDMEKGIAKLQDGDWLCCWEPKGKFCHRLIVADLLEREGFKVIRR